MRSLVRFITSSAVSLMCSALLISAPVAQGQAVPIPFASTYVGLAAGSTSTTVCSTGLPIYSVTGTGANYGDGCVPTQANINAPVGVAIDKLGNVFIADQTHNLVRVVYNGGAALSAAIVTANPHLTGLIPTKGNIYTIVGGPQASPAITSAPYYCSESTTTAGPAGLNRQLDGCPGAQAYIQPRGFGVDNDGNLFIGNVGAASTVRVFYVGGSAAAKLITTLTPSVAAPTPGYVYPVAGLTSTNYSGDGKLATAAGVNTPRGMTVDSNENVYFADQANNVIRRIDGTTGIISTVAGHCVGTTTCAATASSGDGAAAIDPSVNIYFPYDVVFDQYGNLFIAEGGSASVGSGRVRVVYAAGTLPGITNPTVGGIYTYAGAGAATGTAAQQTAFQGVFGINVDTSGYLYVTDYRIVTTSTTANRVWRIDPSNGNIIAYAGTAGPSLLNTTHCQRNAPQTGLISSDNYGDTCPSTQAYLNLPQGKLVFDALGNSYLADRGDNVVRKFNFNNVFPATAVGTSATPLPQAFYFPTLTTLLTKTTSLQGQPTTEFTPTASTATTTDTCLAGTPMNVSANTCVSYVTFAPSAAGTRSGTYTNTDATGALANEAISGVGLAPLLTLDPTTVTPLGSALQPLGVSTDLKNNAYLSDGAGKQVLRASLSSTAGTAVLTGLGKPQQSTIDNYGNLFVADSANNTIVELTAAGTKVTLPITGLSAPQGVAADRYGNLFIADTGNNRLAYFTPVDGALTTISSYPLTLNAPTQLFLDTGGDLFVIDAGNKRLVEFTPNQLPTVVALPTGTVPTAISADLNGTLYVADTTTGTVFTLAPGAATGSALITGLTSPVSLALDTSGDLYLADTALTSVSAYNRTNGSVTFGTTNIGNKSLPITFTLANFGNANTTLSTPPYVETGTNASAFVPSTPSTCAAGLALAAGGLCTQTFLFQPTAATTQQTAQVTFSTTTGQTASSNFSAKATNLILTQLNVTAPGGQLHYGEAATYTVSLVPNTTGSAQPTGSIVFSVDGHTVTTTGISTNPYTFTQQLGVGTHTIAFTYSGDSIYASSNYSTSITIAQAVTTTTVSANQTAAGTVLTAVVTAASTGAVSFTQNVAFYVDGVLAATRPVGNGTVTVTLLVGDGAHTYSAVYQGDLNYAGSSSLTQNLTVARTSTALTLTVTPSSQNGVPGLLLTATVSSASTTIKPSGSVTFSNNGTTLATVTLPSGTTTATYFTNNTKYNFYTFLAAYSGDGLFQPSNATATEGPDFVPVSPTATLSVVDGSQATVALTVVPINGYTGTLTAVCTGLPANSLCRFGPTPFSLTTTASAALTVQVFTGVNPTLAGHTTAIGTAILALLAALCVRRRRTIASSLALVLLALPFALGGCSSTIPGTEAAGTFNTPAGSTVITVTLTDATGLARSANINLTVVSNGHD